MKKIFCLIFTLTDLWAKLFVWKQEFFWCSLWFLLSIRNEIFLCEEKDKIQEWNQNEHLWKNSIALKWKCQDFICEGKKDKIIQREISSMKTSHNLVKIIAFCLKIFLDMKILVYLSAALDFFVQDTAFLLALKWIFTNILLKPLLTLFLLLIRE